MSVMDVHNLKLKDGIHWLERQRRRTTNQEKSALANDSKDCLSTPVSKCLLVGHIVYAAERKGGSKVYILDDGTGMIDCVHWSTDVEDPYHLPSDRSFGESKSFQRFCGGRTCSHLWKNRLPRLTPTFHQKE
eukprot:CAMPEP_0116123018 /NCGR_PEP_ID=MMETSP0329-20121206/4524_1 /TAXON_ID=697910 /ORGANISM="Pseudo-nitzschia arenysensis, Strain B593" /LENGTH=131 /DNA_ID=CAMNT_0003616905 /DNA_START=190 /DNA_END=582 /DNA_ORIENTATION=+